MAFFPTARNTGAITDRLKLKVIDIPLVSFSVRLSSEQRECLVCGNLESIPFLVHAKCTFGMPEIW